MKTFHFLVALILIGITMISIGCTEAPSNPVEYNNKFMTLLNGNEANMNAMNTAMNAQDYAKAEKVRKTWETHLTKIIDDANAFDNFNGDDSFKTDIINGLEVYKSIVTDDYPRLIEFRSAVNKDEAKINEVLNTINTKFVKAAGTINSASSEFELKYAKP